MTFEVYQAFAASTAVYPDVGKNHIYALLGLTGEVGESANKIKKIIRDDKGVFTDERKKEIVRELGDVSWYLAQLSTELGISFEDVIRLNIQKLQSRKDRGALHGSGDQR